MAEAHSRGECVGVHARSSACLTEDDVTKKLVPLSYGFSMVHRVDGWLICLCLILVGRLDLLMGD